MNSCNELESNKPRLPRININAHAQRSEIEPMTCAESYLNKLTFPNQSSDASDKRFLLQCQLNASVGAIYLILSFLFLSFHKEISCQKTFSSNFLFGIADKWLASFVSHIHSTVYFSLCFMFLFSALWHSFVLISVSSCEVFLCFCFFLLFFSFTFIYFLFSFLHSLLRFFFSS